MSDKTRRLFRGGFYLMCALAAAGIALLILFSSGDMPSAWAFSVGMESFSIAASAIIYYCYMQDPDSVEEHTVLFSTLLVANTAGLFLDECAWLVQGAASMAALNRIANTLLYLCNCVIVILFWRYAAYVLQIERKTASAVNRLLSFVSALIFAVLVVNFFVPLIFSVDAAGFYQRKALFPLALCPVLVVLPPLTQGFMGYSGPAKVKRVARLFFLMPIAGVALSCAQFGVSVQYSAVLLSILLALGVIVSDRGKRLAVTRTELNTAMQIQESMLPDSLITSGEHPEFELSASMDPAREVGGDFYDFFMVDGDRLCLVIADVSGKGVPAALFMTMSKIVLQNCSRLGMSPAEALTKANEILCANNRAGMFVTVWLGMLEISTGRLTAASAGHEYPALKRAGGRFELYKDRHGFVLGGMEGARYREYEEQLQPGDSLFVYTDGVPEAEDGEHRQFTTERMLAALNLEPDAAPEQLLKDVRGAVDKFARGAEQFDDLTMLCVAYKGKDQCP